MGWIRIESSGPLSALDRQLNAEADRLDPLSDNYAKAKNRRSEPSGLIEERLGEGEIQSWEWGA